jgi:Ca2+/Na+ antiporter
VIGAGVFVTTVVAGTIALLTPFRSIQRPLLRDIIFFVVASFAAYVAMYDGKLYAWESIGFIVMYVVYLIVLIAGHIINRRLKDRRALLQANNTETASRNYGSVQAIADNVVTTSAVNVDASATTDDNYPQPDVTFALALRHAFLPHDETTWREKSIVGKILTVVKVRLSAQTYRAMRAFVLDASHACSTFYGATG